MADNNSNSDWPVNSNPDDMSGGLQGSVYTIDNAPASSWPGQVIPGGEPAKYFSDYSAAKVAGAMRHSYVSDQDGEWINPGDITGVAKGQNLPPGGSPDPTHVQKGQTL